MMSERPPRPFWETKTLGEMSPAEWESLCDGCGLCCLVRFEDEDTGEIIPTRVHCKLFDPDACRCPDYENRKRHVPDCIKLTPGNIDDHGLDATQLRLPTVERGQATPALASAAHRRPGERAPRRGLGPRPDDLRVDP